MANKPVQFHEEAAVDMESAFEWYFVRSEWAAARFLHVLDEGVRNIAESPTRWPVADLGTRKYLLETFPFALFYRFRQQFRSLRLHIPVVVLVFGEGDCNSSHCALFAMAHPEDTSTPSSEIRRDRDAAESHQSGRSRQA